MEGFRFLNWKVYKDAKSLFSIILEVVRKLPKDLNYNIGGQLIRAAFSIILNIAEGSGKESDKELKKYFDISLGSSYELLAAIDTLRDEVLITEDDYTNIFTRIENISKQLGGFKKHINK